MHLILAHMKTIMCIMCIMITFCAALIFFMYKKNIYLLRIDTCCMHYYADDLKKYVAQKTDATPQQLCQQLQKEFQAIETIDIRLDNQWCYQIFISFYKPAIFIENQGILLANGYKVMQDFFNNEQIKFLPHITIKSTITERIGQEIVAWIKKNPLSMFENMEIIWFSSSKIFLKNSLGRILVVHNQQMITPQMLTICQELMNKIEEEKKSVTKEGIFVADLRFKDQIVISKKKGDYEREII